MSDHFGTLYIKGLTKVFRKSFEYIAPCFCCDFFQNFSEKLNQKLVWVKNNAILRCLWSARLSLSEKCKTTSVSRRLKLSTFPFPQWLFWLKIHLSSPYSGTVIENINLANITNYSYFSIWFFWSSFSCFWNSVEVMLLDNSCCMMVGGLLGGLDIENGDTHKRGSNTIRNNHFSNWNYV